MSSNSLIPVLYPSRSIKSRFFIFQKPQLFIIDIYRKGEEEYVCLCFTSFLHKSTKHWNKANEDNVTEVYLHIIR